MKKTLPWHHTPLGGLVLWLGSIQLAVPVLFLVAIGLGVGTWLDSTRGAAVAKHYVYSAWWFIAVMGLVCVSLVFAVITRYPWKRRHIGFITVHASLVALIAAGFWSMFERVEGNLALREGTQSDVIETADEQIELLEHAGGDFNSVASASAPRDAATLTLAGVKVQVLERWDNCREIEDVVDDSPVPLRAIEIAPVPGPRTAWVGQEDQAGPAPTLMGLKVLVLPEGSDWAPPAGAADAPKGQFVFVVDSKRYVLGDVGQEVMPGWKVLELKRYARALVAGDGVVEGPAGSPENIAVQVKISDGKGTVEQHTAFEKFPDMVMGKPLEGSGNSASRLVPGGAKADPETLVVFGTVAATKIGYVGLDGKGRVVPVETKYPMSISLGARDVTIHRQLARAHAVNRLEKAPPAKNNVACLVVRINDGTELQTVAWKNMAQATGPNARNLVLHYGPRRHQLPFTVRLDEFKKTDYPGTEMAMAYQSTVGVYEPGKTEAASFEIYMNHPYQYGPWRVYQSGFVGEDLSIFSVMRDPGLPLTYISSVFLCVGVVVTFWSRSLSWGHPGIPIRPADTEIKEATNAPSQFVRSAPDAPAARPEPAGSVGG